MAERFADHRRHGGVSLLLGLALLGTGILVGSPANAQEALESGAYRVEMSDGVELEVRWAGRGPLVDGRLLPRPVIAEFSPYAEGCCNEVAGPDYNYVNVHIRGTGSSNGSFDSLGPRTQQDVAEVLGWVCEQPWSNGHTGLVGFSASAITIYNSLHLELPCVDTAVMMSGTHELYRDLLYPGGIINGLPALVVLAGIGGPGMGGHPSRMETDPVSMASWLTGMGDVVTGHLGHPTLDQYWVERGFRGDANDLPILMVNGFFDVESRGAFQAFQELRDDGAHLLVVGAHDGVPEGSGGHGAARARWFDRYLGGVENGVEDEPVVQLFMADGDRQEMLAGNFVTTSGADWPLPDTTWQSLWLDAASSGTATSINDGTLGLEPGEDATASHLAVTSLPTATDPYSTSTAGFDLPATMTDMSLAEPSGLSWTSAPLAEDVWSAGPASLELVLSTTGIETDMYAVLSDVWPDGTAHPMATGRLKSNFPGVDLDRSLVDGDGNIVQPYGRYDVHDRAEPTVERRYHVEFWPVGNRFKAGHRLRLHLFGSSGFYVPPAPAVNTVRLGAGQSRFLVPVLPGSDLSAALGGPVTSPPAPDETPDTTPTSTAPRPGTDAGRSHASTLPDTGAPGPVGMGGAGLLAAAVVRRWSRG